MTFVAVAVASDADECNSLGVEEFSAGIEARKHRARGVGVRNESTDIPCGSVALSHTLIVEG